MTQNKQLKMTKKCKKCTSNRELKIFLTTAAHVQAPGALARARALRHSRHGSRPSRPCPALFLLLPHEKNASAPHSARPPRWASQLFGNISWLAHPPTQPPPRHPTQHANLNDITQKIRTTIYNMGIWAFFTARAR